MIACQSLYGYTRLVPRDQLIMRPSVYGVILHEDRVLVVNNRRTNKLFLPGGAIELGERIADALQREVREETGLRIQVGAFGTFHEHFFYYDPLDEAYHSLMFYYYATPLTLDLVADDQVDDGEAEKPRWRPVGELAAADFNNHGAVIMALLEQACPGDQ